MVQLHETMEEHNYITHMPPAFLSSKSMPWITRIVKVHSPPYSTVQKVKDSPIGLVLLYKCCNTVQYVDIEIFVFQCMDLCASKLLINRLKEFIEKNKKYFQCSKN